MMGSGDEGADEAESINLSFGDVNGSSHEMIVGVPIFM